MPAIRRAFRQRTLLLGEFEVLDFILLDQEHQFVEMRRLWSSGMGLAFEKASHLFQDCPVFLIIPKLVNY